ncbi:uncharacterized protein [Asterias amurensis]|uniref:uncharacterized protein isoform X2 n=1 Tax=Asterias amurensis TaxID=7602 RepID=UPI003AB2695B
MNDSGQGAGSTPSMAEHGVSSSGAEPIFNIKDLSELENELLEENMFMSEDSGSDHMATPFKYVVAVGRGCSQTPNPRDIRLPQAYYENLRRKNVVRAQVNSEKSAGRGRRLQNIAAENPLPSHPSHNVPRRVHQNQLPLSCRTLEKNFLGANTRGLTSEIMEGKACLMERFLGEPLGREAFNPFETPRQAPHSIRSMQTAPGLNFNRMDQWPNINGGGCQSDCGQKGGRYDEVETHTYPKKPLSLQDLMKTISSASSFESSSRKGASGGLSSPGSKKWRKTKKRKEEPAQQEKGVEMSEGAAVPLSRVEDGSQESRNQQGTIPTGANLIQLDSLPEDLTDDHLRAFMSRVGPVVDCHILRDNDTQKCIGIAFVRFENIKDCLSAVSSLHQKDSPFKDSSQQLEVPKLGVYMVS